MYAIRSYYDRLQLQQAHELAELLKDTPSKIRITSYNVCYTKLLRAEAKHQAATDPHNTIQSVKRLMGRGEADLDLSRLPYRISTSDSGLLQLETVQGPVLPVQVSAEISYNFV